MEVVLSEISRDLVLVEKQGRSLAFFGGVAFWAGFVFVALLAFIIALLGTKVVRSFDLNILERHRVQRFAYLGFDFRAVTERKFDTSLVHIE